MKLEGKDLRQLFLDVIVIVNDIKLKNNGQKQLKQVFY